MRCIRPSYLLLMAACWFAAPRPAAAQLTLSTSLGFGFEVSPDADVQAGNIMVAPGYDLLGILRPELGIVGSLEAARRVQPSQLGLELRPMLVITAPLIPLYGRLILAGVNPFTTRRALAYGAALGMGFSIGTLGVFAEAGALPRSEQDQIAWVLEARAGCILRFH